MLLTACQEGGDAGDLLGQWRLKGADSRYISFSGSIVLLRSIYEGQVFGKFRHAGDSLFIEYVSIDGLAADTTLVEDGFGFRPFSDVRLKIDQLDYEQLRLSKDGRVWSFEKY